MLHRDAKLTGTIVEITSHPKLGSYGVLETAEGRHYVWNAGNVYRDGTRITLGATVTFEPVDYYYATGLTSRGHR